MKPRGADDDGSGTTSSLEALRALSHGNYTPETPLEFHYYSAEEGGLLGSQAVAKSYEDSGRKVLAMLQMDMTGDQLARLDNSRMYQLIP